MTTIAYKNGVMASDTMSTWGDDVSYGAQKMARTNNYLMGFCGVYAHARPLYDWIKKLDKQGVHPLEFYQHAEELHDMEKTCTALMVNQQGEIWSVHSDGATAKLYRPYEVVGCGGRFAMGAMHVGCTAAQGIEAAIELDGGTGGEVKTMTFHDKICPPF